MKSPYNKAFQAELWNRSYLFRFRFRFLVRIQTQIRIQTITSFRNNFFKIVSFWLEAALLPRNLLTLSLIFYFYDFVIPFNVIGLSGSGGWKDFEEKKTRRDLLTENPIHLYHFWSTSILIGQYVHFTCRYRHSNTVHKKCLPASIYLNSKKA